MRTGTGCWPIGTAVIGMAACEGNGAAGSVVAVGIVDGVAGGVAGTDVALVVVDAPFQNGPTSKIVMTSA